MAANPKSPMGAGPMLEESHIYHAEATIFSGHLEHPIKQTIQPYGRVVLENTRREPSSPSRSVRPTSKALSLPPRTHRVVGTKSSTRQISSATITPDG